MNQDSNKIIVKEIMDKIEAEGEKKTITLTAQTTDLKSKQFGDALISIMQDGANEFKEKTGRNMTYSEMREMFG
jgi:hypothetical protein